MINNSKKFVWEGIEWEKRIFFDFGEVREEVGEVSWCGRRKLCKKRAMIYDIDWLEGYWYDSWGVFWSSEVEGKVVDWAPEVVAVDLRTTHWEVIMRNRYDYCIKEFGVYREECSDDYCENFYDHVIEVYDKEYYKEGIEEGESFISYLFWLLFPILLFVLLKVL